MTRPRVILERIAFDISGAKNSIVIDGTDSLLELQGDADTPGSHKVYGTDASGDKGWMDISARSLVPGLKAMFKRVEIGPWNMNVPNSNTTVSLGTTGSQFPVILGVTIFADTTPTTNQINLDTASYGNPSARAGGWQLNQGVAAELYSGADFQSAQYSSLAVNRGYVFVMYFE